MIRWAITADVPQMKKLWRTCFPGDGNYVDAFFDHFFTARIAFVDLRDGVLAGMCFVLPGVVRLPEPVEIRYVYALCVDPAFRNLGIATEIVERANEQPTVIVTATESLVDFYIKRHYIPSFIRRIGATIPEDAKEIDVSEYKEIRDLSLISAPFVEWSEHHLAFCIHEAQKKGGAAVTFCRNGQQHVGIYKRVHNEIVMVECTDFSDMANMRFGMARGVEIEEIGYMGLCME